VLTYIHAEDLSPSVFLINSAFAVQVVTEGGSALITSGGFTANKGLPGLQTGAGRILGLAFRVGVNVVPESRSLAFCFLLFLEATALAQSPFSSSLSSSGHASELAWLGT
jgi:hypothetical protein